MHRSRRAPAPPARLRWPREWPPRSRRCRRRSRRSGVRRAGEPSAELRPTVAGEDDMGVGIDKAGDDGPLTGVDHARVAGNRDGTLEVACGSGKDDAVADGREGAVSDDLEPALIDSAPRRRAGTGDELTAVAQNQHGAGRLASFVSGPRRFAGPLRGCGCRSAVGLARAVEQDLVVGAILLADELERAIERLNRAFERSLDVAPAQPQLVDVALDLLEPALRLLEEEVGAALRFPDDELRFGLCRFLISSASRCAVSNVLRRLASRSRCSPSNASWRTRSWRRRSISRSACS